MFVPIHVFGILSIFKVRKGKGDGGPDGVSSMETYAMCKKMASGNVLFDLGSSDQHSVTCWGGGRWEGARGRGHMYTCGQFVLMYARHELNIVKQLAFS